MPYRRQSAFLVDSFLPMFIGRKEVVHMETLLSALFSSSLGSALYPHSMRDGFRKAI